MAISVFDLFKIGIGPSSSHTVGPMKAAYDFVEALRSQDLLERVAGIEIHLYGSLSATGKGHATDRACVMGLMGERPDRIDPAVVGHASKSCSRARPCCSVVRWRCLSCGPETLSGTRRACPITPTP